MTISVPGLVALVKSKRMAFRSSPKHVNAIDPLMTVIASPATSSVSIIVSETCAAVVTITSSLMAGSLVSTKSSQASVLRVQLWVRIECLLTLLGLQRGETSLGLWLSGNAVRGRSRTVRLGERGARTTRLGGVEALRLFRSHWGLLGDGLVLAEASGGATKDIQTSAKSIGTSRGLLSFRRLR